MMNFQILCASKQCFRNVVISDSFTIDTVINDELVASKKYCVKCTMDIYERESAACDEEQITFENGATLTRKKDDA